MRRQIVGLVLLLVLALPSTAFAQQTSSATPTASMWGGILSRTEFVTQILWDDSEPDLPGVSGWRPVSFRSVEYEGEAYLFVELRNTTNSFQTAPQVNIELFQGDFSFGTGTFPPDNRWIPADGSAFYYSLAFFDNSLANSDWDGIAFSTSPITYDPYNGMTAENVLIEGERLINDTPNPIPPVYTGSFIRDSEGIFTAGCMGPSTGANTPPNGSVRLSDAADPDYVPGCGFFFAGEFASDSLNIGGPYTTQYEIVGFDR